MQAPVFQLILFCVWFFLFFPPPPPGDGTQGGDRARPGRSPPISRRCHSNYIERRSARAVAGRKAAESSLALRFGSRLPFTLCL